MAKIDESGEDSPDKVKFQKEALSKLIEIGSSGLEGASDNHDKYLYQ